MRCHRNRVSTINGVIFSSLQLLVVKILGLGNNFSGSTFLGVNNFVGEQKFGGSTFLGGQQNLGVKILWEVNIFGGSKKIPLISMDGLREW